MQNLNVSVGFDNFYEGLLRRKKDMFFKLNNFLKKVYAYIFKICLPTTFLAVKD